MKRGFDLLAPVYDLLARLVFGKSIAAAQLHFLQTAGSPERILVVGGGTGAILDDLRQHHPEAAIDFVELSGGMIRRAKRRRGAAGVRFLACDFREFEPEANYDLVVLPFFLDMFNDQTVADMAAAIDAMADASAKLIVADFLPQPGRTWKRWLLGLTYAFFRVVCRIEAAQLPDWQTHFKGLGWDIVNEPSYFRGTIGAWLLGRAK